jgi:hypothetical protein
MDLLGEAQRILAESKYATAFVEASQDRALAFESTTVLGFAFAYDSPVQLLEHWNAESHAAIARNQLGLRRAQEKAWNVYIVLLARAAADYAMLAALNAIEEDLTGARKIARGGIEDTKDLRDALLPLLPIQNAPRLETVDMVTEIRLRTTELPPQVVKAFLSGATEASVSQVIEETP